MRNKTGKRLSDTIVFIVIVFLLVLQLSTLVLKAMSLIAIPWLWVFSPLWVPFLSICVFTFILVIRTT